LRDGKNFLCRGIFIRNLRELYKKKPCKREALSIGALLGNLEVVSLLEIFETKKNTYLGSFFLDPNDITIFVLGPSGTLAKEQGHKGPVYKT